MEVTFGDDENEEVFLDAADENLRVSCCLARISLCSACLCFFQSSTDVAVFPAAADEGAVTVGVEATADFLEVTLLLLLLLALPLADSWLLPLLDLALLLFLLVEGIDADEREEEVAVLEPLELLLAFLLGGATCAGVLLLLFCRVIVFFSSTSDSDDSSLSSLPAVAPATPVAVVLAPLFFFLFFFFLDFADVLSFPNAPGRDDLFSFES